MESKICSFCAFEEDESISLTAGKNSYICANCIFSAYCIVFGDLRPSDIEVEEFKSKVDFFESIRLPQTTGINNKIKDLKEKRC